MSVQMTIRLSDESAAFVDELVAGGDFPSRASVVDRLIRRERRRALARRDAAIYAAEADDSELDGLAEAAIATLRPGDLD